MVNNSFFHLITHILINFPGIPDNGSGQIRIVLPDHFKVPDMAQVFSYPRRRLHIYNTQKSIHEKESPDLVPYLFIKNSLLQFNEIDYRLISLILMAIYPDLAGK